MFNHAISVSFTINSAYNAERIPAIDLAAAMVKRAAEILAQEIAVPSSTLDSFEVSHTDSYALTEDEAKEQNKNFSY